MQYNVRVAWHRNGVCGEGFYGVAFKHEGHNMVAVRFEDQPDDNCRCAVLRIDDLPANIGNAWRGDCFKELVDAAIAAYEGLDADARNYRDDAGTVVTIEASRIR